MKLVRRLTLTLAGAVLLVAAGSGFAEENQSLAAEDRADFGVAHMVDMIMAEDQTTLIDTLVGLEKAVRAAQERAETANLVVLESRINAAGKLLALAEAEVALEQWRKVNAKASQALSYALDELGSLAALPRSQETRSDIAFLEDEIVVLQRDAEGAARELAQARQRVATKRFEAGVAEAVIGSAERTVEEARQLEAALSDEIEKAHRAFDDERQRVSVLVAALSPGQRSALDRTLKPVLDDEFMAVNIDADHLQRAVDEAYTDRQIEYLARALVAEAQLRQFTAFKGDDSYLEHAAREKERYLSEIERIEAEKFDALHDGKSAFGIASDPRKAAPKR